MDGCDSTVMNRLARMADHQAVAAIKGDSPDFRLTKSLLNLLYNTVVVGSVRYTRVQKEIIDTNKDLVWRLLDRNIPVARKRNLFARNPAFAVALAGICPAAGR